MSSRWVCPPGPVLVRAGAATAVAAARPPPPAAAAAGASAPPPPAASAALRFRDARGGAPGIPALVFGDRLAVAVTAAGVGCGGRGCGFLGHGRVGFGAVSAGASPPSSPSAGTPSALRRSWLRFRRCSGTSVMSAPPFDLQRPGDAAVLADHAEVNGHEDHDDERQ